MTKAAAVQQLRDTKLYAILDTGYSDPRDWPALARALTGAGVGALQIRAKNAAAADIAAWAGAVLAAAADTPLIINDHPAIAAQVGAAGVHVGQDDLSVAAVRQIAGVDILVGKSTHSVAQAVAAQAEGADYIGFGPIFATPTKPSYRPVGSEEIRRMTELIHIPHFCIGGIKLENTAALHAAGARRVVIVSGLLQSPDPARYAREVCRLLTVAAKN